MTGFGFAFDHLLPSHRVGIISLVLLAVAIPARYVFHLLGAWRLDLCRRRSDGPVSECLRLARAGLPKGTGPDSSGSDAERAALFGRPACGYGGFCRTDRSRNHPGIFAKKMHLDNAHPGMPATARVNCRAGNWRRRAKKCAGFPKPKQPGPVVMPALVKNRSSVWREA